MSDPLLAHQRVFQQVRRDTAILKAMDALDAAEKQFTAYALHHRDKGAGDKARTNYAYAMKCADALENLRLVCNPLDDGQQP